MPSSLELGMEDFDSVYHNIQDSFDSFHEFGTGYIADMSKNQFDTDCHDLSPYLTVPAFDTSLSNISSGPSSYPSSHINTPVNVDPESSAADEDSDMDSDYDVEHLSLSDEKKHIVIGHATYATSNASERVFEDMPYVPPTSPAHLQAPVRSQRRRTQTKVATVPVYVSDEDADFESEGGDATEDEYIPTPPLNPLKRRRSVETTVSSSGSVSQSPSSSRPAKQRRTSRGRRNIQASERRPQPEDWTTEDDKKWRCQHRPCDHRQWNKRGPDFRRHQRTHTRESQPTPYVCWGVELEHAAASTKPIPGPTDKIRGIPVEYKDVMRIGGCFETFSRLDALKRHLEKTKKGKECATDFNDFRGALSD